MRSLNGMLLSIFFLIVPSAGWAQSLDDHGAPDSKDSAMYTLDDIYNRLDTGAEGAKREEGFTEPSAGPAPTGPTLDNIMGKAPALDGDNGASAADVLTGKTFWGLLTGGGWGLKTGNLATQTPDNTTVSQPAGYYEAFNLSTVEPNLTTVNIRSGVSIFGVAGDANVVNTGSGDAVEGDILAGKKAWVDGAEVTGNIATQTLSNANDTVAAGYYASTTLGAVDSDLATGNIRSGVSIFGVAGDGNVVDTSSGDAVAGDMLAGKKAWVDGAEVNGTAAAGANFIGGDGLKTFTVPDGLYTGSKTATANDADLAAGNIKKSVEIFGVTGTYPLAGVARTGQTPTVPLNPAPEGSDGDLQKGVAWPNPRFTAANGTVTDNLTGLIWLQRANCNNTTGTTGTASWENALAFCNTLNDGECGLNDGSEEGDWRLPNVMEILSLIDWRYSNPALSNADGTDKWSSGNAFTDVQSDSYWSSMTRANATSTAWHVHLNFGYVACTDRNIPCYVWPVRGGQ